jgi:hypothetical protein
MCGRNIESFGFTNPHGLKTVLALGQWVLWMVSEGCLAGEEIPPGPFHASMLLANVVPNAQV